ncbi:MAG: hypothetical protein QOK05_1980 [Chloroflexota bacterium]|jgi:putative NADH-flavin reductase|nr:hypothetical protein [Chloroflexota bacterium]
MIGEHELAQTGAVASDRAARTMKIAVFGANGPTGQHLVRQALSSGHSVTAVTRHPETFGQRHQMLRVLGGDVYDPASVAQAVAGHDAVLSTLGVPYSRNEITVYSEGVANIVESMRQNGVRRLVCVSSSATDPATRFNDTGGGFFFEKVLKPLITMTMGKTMYADMGRMEDRVMRSGLDWTIVRPSGLFDAPVVSAYQVAEGHLRGRFTARTDLANCMLHQLDSDRYVGKVVAVATFEGEPSVLDLIRKEAFQKRRK